jgi:thiamine monophosphate kinase
MNAACDQFFGGQSAFLDFALHGGEDYELLIVVPPARMTKLWDLARRYDWDVFDIGEIRSPGEGLVVIGPDGEEMDVSTEGYRHF